MEWKISKSTTNKTEYIYVKNKKYLLLIKIVNGNNINTFIMKLTSIENDFRYNEAIKLNEIEKIIIAKEKTKLFIDKIEQLEFEQDCKNDYNKELLEFKEYFMEGKNEMGYDSNSCIEKK